MRFLRQRFQRLQWRLTLSYTAVTVAALLLVELLFFGGLFYLLRSDWLLNEITTALNESLVAEARYYLAQEPPDEVGLNRWLANSFAEGYTAATEPGDSALSGWRFDFGQEQQAFILDGEGRLLAQYPATTASFDLQVLNLSDLLTAVEQGQGDIYQLRRRLDDGRLVNLFPIEGENGRFLGTFIFIIPLPGLDADTLGPLLTMILYSLIPFTLGAGLIGTIFGFLTARHLTRRIETVSQAADRWSRGDFSAVARDPAQDELGRLSQRLNRMAEQLHNLMQTRQELATLEERNRLARDLHDAVKQQVFATAMQVGAAKALIESNPTAAAGHLAEAESLAHQAQQELTTLIQELRPAALHDQGVAAALRHYAANWMRQNKIEAVVQVQGERPLPLPVEQALFRVAQEALANAARHSRASQVTIHLAWPSAGEVSLTISDNGQGFMLQAAPAGLGIQSMGERVEELGGQFDLQSRPSAGTTIIVRLPYEAG
jgi:two-component system, NarL family, sensor histidine kinase LiaS